MEAAATYHKTAHKQYEDGLSLIELLSPTENSKVLDLGCGTGYLSNALGEKIVPGGIVVGVDPDEARVRVAREKYGSNNVVFFEGSTDEFPENKYDFVFSNYVFHWVKDKEAAFQNVYASLKPGGKFGFLVPLYLPKGLFDLTALNGESKAQSFKDSVYHESANGFEELAIDCGFSVDYMAESEIVYAFPDINATLDWWHGTTHGFFKPELIDQHRLQEFEMLYTNSQTGEVELPSTNVVFIMRKN